MTQPVVHGYPDFGRFQARATKVYLDTSGNYAGSDITFGPFFVGDIEYLAHAFSSVTVNSSLFLEYYADDALSTFLGDHWVSCRAGVRSDMSLPVLGPWLSVRLHAFASPGSWTLALYEATGRLLSTYWSNSSTALINTIGVNIAAGGNTVIWAPVIRAGRAVWRINPGATAWVADLIALEGSGTITIIDRITQLEGTTQQSAYLPAQTAGIRVFNNDAAAKTFNVFLNAPIIDQ